MKKSLSPAYLKGYKNWQRIPVPWNHKHTCHYCEEQATRMTILNHDTAIGPFTEEFYLCELHASELEEGLKEGEEDASQGETE